MYHKILIMHKITIILILTTSISLFSCAETKQISTNPQVENKFEIQTEIESTIKTSAFAKFFISDFHKELEKHNTSIENYKPSKELIAKYNIQLFNNKYFIQGFVTINSQLNQAELKKLNISTGKPMSDKMTIRIPVQSFRQFLNLKGIEYFEMNPKSEFK